MFLLGFAQNLIESSAAQRGHAPKSAAPLPATYPGTMVQPEHLQRLVDDCFTHLTRDQRTEIFDMLHAELLKPANAAVRGDMIRYFAEMALQVRALQIRLGELSSPEKEALAVEFHRSAARLPARERAELEQIVSRRLLPLPSDMGALFAAQFERDPGEAAGPAPLNLGAVSAPSAGSARGGASGLAFRHPGSDAALQ